MFILVIMLIGYMTLPGPSLPGMTLPGPVYYHTCQSAGGHIFCNWCYIQQQQQQQRRIADNVVLYVRILIIIL